MVKQSLFILTLRYLLLDLGRQIIYFPIWWYTRGLKRAVASFATSTARLEYRLGVIIWVKNLFVPMFGQYDWQGRIISFFMRLIQIIVRSILFGFGIIGYFAFIIVWICLPPLVVWGIIGNIYHLSIDLPLDYEL